MAKTVNFTVTPSQLLNLRDAYQAHMSEDMKDRGWNSETANAALERFLDVAEGLKLTRTQAQDVAFQSIFTWSDALKSLPSEEPLEIEILAML